GLEGRSVVRQLEQAAEQDGHVLDGDPGSQFERGDQLVAQVRVRAAEVEQELDVAHLVHHVSIQGRSSVSCVHVSRGCWWMCQYASAMCSGLRIPCCALSA